MIFFIDFFFMLVKSVRNKKKQRNSTATHKPVHIYLFLHSYISTIRLLSSFRDKGFGRNVRNIMEKQIKARLIR